MARLDAPGALHHVMVRGIERREIFRDDDDRWDLVERLARLILLWGGVCFAWVFMANHVHLVVRTRQLPLAWLMRRLNTGFALRFNQRHERVGYLFQNRFKSRLVEDEADLLNLVRYVHLNPVRAGLVEDLEALAHFPWCGHGALVGARPPFTFESVDRVLSLFDEEPAAARCRLAAWMSAPPDLEESRSARAVEEENLETREVVRADPDETSALRPLSLDELIGRICNHFSIAIEDVARGTRDTRATRARAVIAFVAVVRLGVPVADVAGRVGVSRQAVARAIARGAQIERDERPLGPREET